MPARSVVVGALVAGLVGLTGCSVPGLGGGSATGTPAAPATAAAPAPAPAPATAPPLVPPDGFRNALATVQVPMSLDNDQQALLKIDVLGLKRQGKVLVLTAALTPTTSQTDALNLYEMLGQQSWQPQLIDVNNLKLYRVATAGSGELRSKDIGDRVPSGSTLLVEATFAAPPAGVDALNLQFADQVPTFEGVRIQ
jgi:hypothetical protein